MGTMTSADIREIFREGVEEYQSAVLTTFMFDPGFFESSLLPILASKETQNIIVLTDISEYTKTFGDARYVGIRYYLEPIKVKCIFHPKVTMLASKEFGKLMVGSCNITESGYGKNVEIIAVFECSANTLSVESQAVFFDVREFLILLVKRGYVRSQKHASKIIESIDLPWIPETRPSAPDVRFLHNLDKPILSQVLDILGGEKVQEITVVCNDFDPDGELIIYLRDHVSKKINVVLQPKKNNFPSNKIPKEVLHDLAFSRIDFAEKETRTLHGKVLIFKTEGHSYCLFGSANATAAALLFTPNDGNIEACILRKATGKEHFDYLLSNPDTSVEKITVNQVDSNPDGLQPQGLQLDLTVVEARIENHRNLVLEFVPTLPPQYRLARVKLFRAVDNEFKILDVALDSGNNIDKISIELDSTLISYVEDSCYVSLEFRIAAEDTKPLISSSRWITTERLELQADLKKYLEVAGSTYGRFGLISFLNRVSSFPEASDLLLYYLSFLDFDDLLKPLKPLPPKIPRTPKLNEDGVVDEHADDEHPHLTSDEVLLRILKRNNRKLNEQFEEGAAPLTPQTFRELFNLFMLIDKVIIWFVLRENRLIEKLNAIPRNLGGLCSSKFISRLKKDLGGETASKLVNSLGIPIHVIALARIVHDLHQKQDPLWKTRNRNVIRVFEEALRSGLDNLCTELGLEDVSRIPLSKISDALKEYNEFETLNLTAEKILEHVTWKMHIADRK